MKIWANEKVNQGMVTKILTRKTVEHPYILWKEIIGLTLILIIFALPLKVHLLFASPAPGTRAPSPPAAEGAKTRPLSLSPSKPIPTQKVNINTATQSQLEALPEIGPTKAKAIIAGRPYRTPEDIMKIKGIKVRTYNKIKDFITVQ